MDINKNIEDMINSGEIGVMTECAYGSAVADTECDNVLNKKKVIVEEEPINSVK